MPALQLWTTPSPCSPMTAGNEVCLVPQADVEPALVVGKKEGRPRAHLISSLSSGAFLKWGPQIIQVIRPFYGWNPWWLGDPPFQETHESDQRNCCNKSHKGQLVAMKILQPLRRKRAKCRRYRTCMVGMPKPWHHLSSWNYECGKPM